MQIHSRVVNAGAKLDAVVERHGPLGVVVVAFGILGDQARAEHDAEHARAIVHTDYVAHVTVLTHLAQVLRALERDDAGK